MALPVSLTRLKPDRSGSALESSDVRGKKSQTVTLEAL